MRLNDLFARVAAAAPGPENRAARVAMYAVLRRLLEARADLGLANDTRALADMPRAELLDAVRDVPGGAAALRDVLAMPEVAGGGDDTDEDEDENDPGTDGEDEDDDEDEDGSAYESSSDGTVSTAGRGSGVVARAALSVAHLSDCRAYVSLLFSTAALAVSAVALTLSWR